MSCAESEEGEGSCGVEGEGEGNLEGEETEDGDESDAIIFEEGDWR